jgi:CopA family copper-resistance protein
MDGVPGLSFNGIAPGETYVYRFHVRQGGTYWYHSHSAFQEQLGLYGALIIEPREPDPFHYDREHVVLLSDWTDEPPERVFAKLKKQAHYYNFQQRTVGDFFRDVRRAGWRETLADRKAWGEMRMTPTDLADVTGYTYTYLMNGTAPAGNWTGLFRPGERVRLRFINGSAMTYFDVRIPGLKMTVVAGRRAERPPGVGGRVPHRRGRDLRRDRRAHRAGRVHDLRAVARPQRLRARHAGGGAKGSRRRCPSSTRGRC